MSWIFNDYVSDRGENLIRQWLSAQSAAVRIKIDVRLRYLQGVAQLKYPYVEKWVGEDDLYEVRVVFGGEQYRMLGCYGPARGEFTLLVGAEEKGNRLEPRDAVKVARARMILITEERHVCKHFG